MIKNIENKVLIENVNLLLEKYNVKLVELDIMNYGNEFKFKIILYKEDNLTLDLLESIHIKIYEIIEKLNFDKYTLEISSPGINRVFKTEDEYNIFKNKKIKLILKGSKIMEGINNGYSNDIVKLKVKDKDININIQNIIKAKLA